MTLGGAYFVFKSNLIGIYIKGLGVRTNHYYSPLQNSTLLKMIVVYYL